MRHVLLFFHDWISIILHRSVFKEQVTISELLVRTKAIPISFASVDERLDCKCQGENLVPQIHNHLNKTTEPVFIENIHLAELQDNDFSPKTTGNCMLSGRHSSCRTYSYNQTILKSAMLLEAEFDKGNWVLYALSKTVIQLAVVFWGKVCIWIDLVSTLAWNSAF